MPVQFANFLNAPVTKPDTAGYEDFFSNILKGYQGGVKHKLDTQQGKEKLSEQEMKNALTKKYGESREQAEIDYLKNRALTEGYGPALAQADIALKGSHEDYYNAQSDGSGKGGVKIPSSVMASELNAGLANKQRLFLDPLMQHKYQGLGGAATMGEDLLRYQFTRDPKLKLQLENDLVKAAVANKLAPEFAGFQLIGQKVKPTVHALQKQEKAIKQGWAAGFDKAMDNLPKHIQDKANALHSKILKDTSALQAEGLDGGMSQGSDISEEVAINKDDNIRKFEQSQGMPEITEADIAATARKYNMTPEQVMQKLGRR